MMRNTVLTLLCMMIWAVMCVAAPTAFAADVAAGKALADAQCVRCHAPADWKGESTASLESLLRDVSNGKVKHSKSNVKLSDADIANIAAYWLTAKK